MRKAFAGIVLSLFLASPAFGGAKADAPLPSAGPMNVVLVDFNRALNEVADGKRAKARLKDEFREKQKQLDRLQSDLKAARDSIDRDRLLLSQEVLEEREAKYRQKFAELNQRLDIFKKDMASKETELTQEILTRLRSIVREIGRKDAYTLILEKSQDVVLYAPEGSDITDRVIAVYDRGSGAKKR